jgi:transposase-like protein
MDIRKAIYTTNAIESLNSVIRHATKKRKIFPTDDSVKKGGIFSNYGSKQKMDDAHSELESCHESL